MESKEYDLGGKKYIQRPIMFGQLRELIPLLEGSKFEDDLNPLELVRVLGNRIHKALAVVLVEEGMELREALDNIHDRARDIECRITPEQVVEVIEDFFACNRASSVIGRLREAIAKIRAQIPAAEMFEGKTSSGSPGSSPKEISPEGTPSSGKPKRG